MNLVVIPSIINVSSAPLSYTPTRSVFTPQTRLEQTLETIKSAREKIPNAVIVLIEGSCLSTDQKEIFSHKIDYLYEAANLDPSVVKACQGPSKGYGETQQLLSYFEKCEHFKTISDKCLTISKLGGRIRLTDIFRFRIPEEKPIIRLANTGNRYVSSFGQASILTIFYTVPSKHLNLFFQALRDCCSIPAFVRGKISIEKSLYKTWNAYTDFEVIPVIGLEGRCAPTGSFYEL